MERIENYTLLTDFYELTMMGGYWAHGRHGQRVVFDLFFRSVPRGGGYCIAAGLESAIDYVLNIRFGPDELAYLRGLGIFPDEFISALGSFRFTGDIDAVPEGTVVLPHEPLLRVTAPLWEAQLIETALLNQVNFQTLIATKAARIVQAAAGDPVLEFGSRRAQGADGALSASRAAFIGGVGATSNSLAGKRFGIPVKGTMAHSWIMSFPTELEAFRAYGSAYPDSCLLLVDTYDTLKSGVPNAIVVAKELESQGHRFVGIRLDSGDLTLLSRGARQLLDQAGLRYAKIVASNDLDEYLIQDLKNQGSKIDIWGVGTSLATSKDCPALGGVYKLAAADNGGTMEPRIKVANNIAKITDPGVKELYRLFSPKGKWLGDLLALAHESVPESGCFETRHRTLPHVRRIFEGEWRLERLLQPVLRNGKQVREVEPLSQLKQRTLEQLSKLDPQHLRLKNPELAWLGLTKGLWQLKQQLLREHLATAGP